MNKLTLPSLRKLINETINEIDLEERADEGHHGSKDETHDLDENDMQEDQVDEVSVTVGQAKEEGEKHLEESAQLNRWRKLAGILKG